VAEAAKTGRSHLPTKIGYGRVVSVRNGTETEPEPPGDGAVVSYLQGFPAAYAIRTIDART